MKQVNIIVGRFQPFTRGHLKCVETAYDKLHIPTIIIMIDTPKSKVDEKHPFSTDLLLPIYKDLFSSNKMVEDIVTSKSADIVKIGEMLWGMGYEIRSWTCGTDRIDSYTKMSTKYKEESHLADDFEMIEVKRSDEDISATKVRQSLLNDDYKTFLQLMPPMSLKAHVKGYYNKLRGEIKNVYEKI